MISRLGIAAAMTAIGLAVLPALAATTRSPDARFTYAAPGRHQAAPFALPKSATVLFNNFATAYPGGLYFSGEGNTLTGPGMPLNPGIASAAQFTPTRSGIATDVYAAVGYLSGNSVVDVAIYTDNAGVPGSVLTSVETKAWPIFGACCQVVQAKLASAVALTAGTPYWVVVSADAPVRSSFSGAWAISTTNQVTDVLAGTNFDGAGWQSYATNTPPAFAITGN